MAQYDKYFKKILISHKEIVEKTAELAKWVNKEYANSKDLIIVGLLKGSIPFLAELIKGIEVEHSLDFLTISSYGGAMDQNSNIKMIMDLKQDIYGKEILIVEDIVDSGRTLSKVTEMLLDRHPKSLKVITLMDKPSCRKVKFTPDKKCFDVPNEFLAGFGLDVKGKLRNVPYVGIFDKEKFDEL